MDLSLDFLKIIFTLLPGFISAEVFFKLTPYVKQSPFERIIQALIMTSLVKGGLVIIDYVARQNGTIIPVDMDIVISILLAVLLGVLLSWCANNDFPNRILRPRSCKSGCKKLFFDLMTKINLTNTGLFPNEWFSFFRDADGFAILHLSGERRMMGVIQEFPESSDKGHFVVVNAGWIDDNNNVIELTNVKKILLPVSEVSWVELIKTKEKDENKDV